MDSRKRFSVGIAASIVIHIIIGIALAYVGFIFLERRQDRIIEIDMVEIEGAKPRTVTQVQKQQVSERPPEKDDVVDKKLPEKKKEAKSDAKTKSMPPPQQSGQGKGEKGTGMGAVTKPGAGIPVSAPQLIGFSRPYPASARKAGHQGTVVVRVVVTTGGSVSSATVAGSSGYGDLDSAAVNAAYSWSFEPARDKYGTPIACAARIPVTYRLK